MGQLRNYLYNLIKCPTCTHLKSRVFLIYAIYFSDPFYQFRLLHTPSSANQAGGGVGRDNGTNVLLTGMSVPKICGAKYFRCLSMEMNLATREQHQIVPGEIFSICLQVCNLHSYVPLDISAHAHSQSSTSTVLIWNSFLSH